MIAIERHLLRINAWTRIKGFKSDFLTAVEEFDANNVQRKVFVHLLVSDCGPCVEHRFYLAGVYDNLPREIERKHYVQTLTLPDGRHPLHLFDLGEKT